MKVYVTGIGIVSGIGLNVEDTLSSIRNGKAGTGKPTLFETIHDCVVSEVKYDNRFLSGLLEIPSAKTLSRTALLGMKAVGEALNDSGINDPHGTSFISATSVGGMDLSEIYYRQLQDGSAPDMQYIVSHDCGDSTERIALHFGLKKLVTTISTACSSAANAIMFGARLIRNGIADCVVAGGTDALTLFTLNGFHSLMILDPGPCRPFDDSRCGLNLGEGAGYIVMESEERLMKSGKKPYCRLAGYANANDAYHQTASSPDGTGPFLAMSQALETGGIPLDTIDYINVHGTGTPNNDLSEGKALYRIFGDQVPAFSSTKTYTGHTLGAAGGIEAVLSVLSIRYGLVYPALNFEHPMHELALIPERTLSEGADIRNVLSNSFGFGGNCSALIFSKR